MFFVMNFVLTNLSFNMKRKVPLIAKAAMPLAASSGSFDNKIAVSKVNRHENDQPISTAAIVDKTPVSIY